MTLNCKSQVSAKEENKGYLAGSLITFVGNTILTGDTHLRLIRLKTLIMKKKTKQKQGQEIYWSHSEKIFKKSSDIYFTIFE